MPCSCQSAARAACDHVASWLDAGERSASTLAALRRLPYIAEGALDRHEAPADAPGPPPAECFECGEAARGLHACLDCVYIACRDHVREHAQKSDHKLLYEIARGCILCTECSDYSYLDKPWRGAGDGAQSKRRRVPEAEPAPTAAELELLKRGSRGETSDPLLGLRGLNNLGNTCFVSAVAQSLVHNPLVRSYFLSDQHPRRFCTASQQAAAEAEAGAGAGEGGQGAVGVGGGRPKPCLACELDRLVSEAFSGERAPYSPDSLLTALWMHAQHLAAADQQDAHEFLMAALDALHGAAGPAGPPGAPCRCLAHRAFAGTLRSDLRCAACGHVSASYEPFLDVSLDLRLAPEGQGGAPGEAIAESLHDCLRRYTRPERLSARDAVTCARCRQVRECTKRLSVRRLPPVLCFHLKRFEHSVGPAGAGGAGRAASSKIDAFVRFPLDSLDMRPYLSPPLDGEEPLDPDEVALYDLHSSVIHFGSIDNGHYICKARAAGRWFAFDDACVSAVEASDVRSSRAYLLFYVARDLSYRPAGGEQS
eukprot:tig00020616_g12273.t1